MITQKIKQSSILFLWLFIACFFTKNLKAQCTGVSVSDSLELVNFYNATGGENWTNNDGWLVEPVSNWFGITLSEDGCFVEVIELSQNNLIGVLLDLNLPNLIALKLMQPFWEVNSLSGTIPDFNNLPKIETLNLSHNQLIGNIPDFNNLPNLGYLSVSNNQLTGTIPNLVEVNR